MRMTAAIACLVLLPLASRPAAAAEDPEAVYAKYHRAVMASNLEEMYQYGPAKRRGEVRGMSLSSKEAAVKAAQHQMPVAYKVQQKLVQGDGRMTLILSGTWVAEGLKPQTMYAVVRMLMEYGEWRIDESNWGIQKPSAAALAAPAAAERAAPKVSAAEKAAPKPAAAEKAVPKFTGAGGQLVGSTPAAPLGRTLGDAKPGCVYKPVMTAADMEACR